MDVSQAPYQQRAARNHIDWFSKQAQLAGEPWGVSDGVAWAGSREPNWLFPELDGEASGVVDRLLARPEFERAISIGCWSLTPSTPTNLAAILLARGFGWGWEPHWMRLDLGMWTDTSTAPRGVTIGHDDLAGPVGRAIPYLPAARPVRPVTDCDSGPVHVVGARVRGRLVGHIALNVHTRGRSAGIYSCGVAPRARKHGIGAALTAAACRIALDHGCDDVLLNATSMGESVYRRLGFESQGFGQTWWHHHPQELPPHADVLFVEQLCSGSLRGLEPPAGFDFDVALPCGLVPVEAAVRCHQPAAVEWLVAQGATLDMVSCWDLGWKERAGSLLAANPSLANLKRGELGATPLHTAVDRNDEALARLVLSAHPDLSITDDRYGGTALGWTDALNRPNIADLIKSSSS